MFRTIINVVLGSASIYFFYQGNHRAGVVLLVLTFIGIYQHKFQPFGEALCEIAKHADLERKSNYFLQLIQRTHTLSPVSTKGVKKSTMCGPHLPPGDSAGTGGVVLGGIDLPRFATYTRTVPANWVLGKFRHYRIDQGLTTSSN